MKIKYPIRIVKKEVRALFVKEFDVCYNMTFMASIGIAARHAEDTLNDIKDNIGVAHNMKRLIGSYEESVKRINAAAQCGRPHYQRVMYDDYLRLCYDGVKKDIDKLVLACIKQAKKTPVKNPEIVANLFAAYLIWLIAEKNVRHVFDEVKSLYHFDVRADSTFNYTRIEPCRARLEMIGNELVKNCKSDVIFGETDDDKIANTLENLAAKIYSSRVRDKAYGLAIKQNWPYLSDSDKAQYKEYKKQMLEFKKEKK